MVIFIINTSNKNLGITILETNLVKVYLTGDSDLKKNWFLGYSKTFSISVIRGFVDLKLTMLSNNYPSVRSYRDVLTMGK